MTSNGDANCNDRAVDEGEGPKAHARRNSFKIFTHPVLADAILGTGDESLQVSTAMIEGVKLEGKGASSMSDHEGA